MKSTTLGKKKKSIERASKSDKDGKFNDLVNRIIFQFVRMKFTLTVVFLDFHCYFFSPCVLHGKFNEQRRPAWLNSMLIN